MFAVKVAKPTAKGTRSSDRDLTSAHPALAGHQHRPAPDTAVRVAAGATPAVLWNFGQIPLFPLAATRKSTTSERTPVNCIPQRPLMHGTQASLGVGQVNDPHEREADHVADQVLAMADREPVSRCIAAQQAGVSSYSDASSVRRKCTCESTGAPCDDCRKQEGEVHRSPYGAGPVAAHSFDTAHELAHVMQRCDGGGACSESASQVTQVSSGHGPMISRQAAPPTSATPAPVPAPSAAPASGSPVPTVDCTPANISEIAIAMPLARAMVRHAIDLLGRPSTSAVTALLDKYFNDHSASTYLHALVGYRNLLSGISGSFTVECEQPGSFMYDYFCGGTLAYVRTLVPGPNVHLCGSAFGRSDTALAETIAHESSHKFDNTGDKAYCWGGCPASLDRWAAYNNADSFSKFARDSYLTIL